MNFKYQIMNDDDETVLEGDTFISSHISSDGENEMVTMEVSKALRVLKNILEKEEFKKEFEVEEELSLSI